MQKMLYLYVIVCISLLYYSQAYRKAYKNIPQHGNRKIVTFLR